MRSSCKIVSEGSPVWPPSRQGLYDPANEHDACGLGFIAHIKGQKRHAIITQALSILRNLSHRGATGADPLQGDGAGILIQLPDRFLRKACGAQGLTLPAVGQYGVGMVFLPKEPASRMACEQEIERAVASEGQILLGWRNVPTNNGGLSERTKDVEPVIRQVFIARGSTAMDQDALERKLYIIRKKSGHAIQALQLRHGKEFYVTSMSSRTIVYKGMLLAHQVGEYFVDLSDESMVSALAMVHQRFSTNTFPTWDLAHPFRLVCHNGEINTLRGNVNWIRARQQGIASTVLGEDLDKIWPLIYDGQSDSASFDNALELLVMGGYSLAHAMMLMIPEAWAGNPLMDEDRRAFYEYHAALMEPWDGPAAMAFTDGRQIGATLDRNGLRPARFIVTDDDYIVMASEVGVLDIPGAQDRHQVAAAAGQDAARRHRAGPHHRRRRVEAHARDGEAVSPVDRALADRARRPAGTRAAAAHRGAAARPPAGVRLHAGRPQGHPRADGALGRGGDRLDGQRRRAAGAVPAAEGALQLLQAAVRAGDESADRSDPRRARDVARHVHRTAAEPARRRRSRGCRGLADAPRGARSRSSRTARWRRSATPTLFTGGAFKTFELDICYPAAWGANGMEAALASISAAAEDAIHLGYNILVVSDRKVSADLMPIPALLATAAVHQHLVRKGLRTSTGLVVETGSAREVHHFALLAGYGAEAIHPYLALETLRHAGGRIPRVGAGAREALHQGDLEGTLQGDVEDGHLHVPVVLRRADLRGGRPAARFRRQVLHRHGEQRRRHRPLRDRRRGATGCTRRRSAATRCSPTRSTRAASTTYRIRGEDHMWTPDSIAKLQHAARTGNAQTYKEYAALINDQTKRMLTLRGLFELQVCARVRSRSRMSSRRRRSSSASPPAR